MSASNSGDVRRSRRQCVLSLRILSSRFTSFTTNFVICCYQVTKNFCSRYGCASAFPARNPPLLSWSSCRCRNFGHSGSESKYCVYPVPLFLAALKLTHEKSSRVRPCTGTLSSTKLSVNSSHHSGKSRNGFLRTVSLSPFFCVYGFCWFVRRASRAVLLVLSLLVDARCNVGSAASCDTDVGDVGVAELEKLVDKPGTTIGT